LIAEEKGGWREKRKVSLLSSLHSVISSVISKSINFVASLSLPRKLLREEEA